MHACEQVSKRAYLLASANNTYTPVRAAAKRVMFISDMDTPFINVFVGSSHLHDTIPHLISPQRSHLQRRMYLFGLRCVRGNANVYIVQDTT